MKQIRTVKLTLDTLRAYINAFLLRFVKQDSLMGLKTFIRNVSNLAFFFVLARCFTVVANIIGARLLSKNDYGAANLAMTVGTALATLAIMGIGPSMVKYGAPSKTPERYISAGMWAVLASTSLCCILGLVFYEPLAALTKIAPDVFVVGILMGVMFTFYAFVAAAQQTLSRFKLRGVMELALAIFYTVTLLMFLYFGSRSWLVLGISWLFAYILSIIIGIWPIHKECDAGYQVSALKEMFPYAWPMLVSNIGFFFCSQIQRLELNSLMSEGDVATYVVYYASSVNLAAFVWGMASTVFFTKSAMTTNRENLWNMTAHAAKLGMVPLFLVMFAGTAVYVYLCGDKYPFDLVLAVLFAVAAVITGIANSLGQVIGAHGVRAVRIGLWMAICMGIITTFGTYVMIKWCGMGLYATPVAIILAYSVQLVWLFAIRKSFF